MREFITVEEVDEYLSRTVYIESEKAVLVGAKIEKEVLILTFEYDDGTTENIDSLTAFQTVTIDGKAFGYEE